jgi:hypothetical protein
MESEALEMTKADRESYEIFSRQQLNRVKAAVRQERGQRIEKEKKSGRA